MIRYLETDRLRLRQATMADAALLVELDSDPEVMRYLTGGRATPLEEFETVWLPGWLEEYEQHPMLAHWIAEDRVTGEFLGWFELAPYGDEPGVAQLGYRLRRAAWGRGLATEGARALVAKAFTELGVRRVVAFTMAVNTASRRVMEKAGLRFVRIFDGGFPDPIPGDEHGEAEYAVTAAEWSPSA